MNKWLVVKKNKNSVLLKFSHNGKKSFPFKYEALQKFRIVKNSLEIKVSITNKDKLSTRS